MEKAKLSFAYDPMTRQTRDADNNAPVDAASLVKTFARKFKPSLRALFGQRAKRAVEVCL